MWADGFWPDAPDVAERDREHRIAHRSSLAAAAQMALRLEQADPHTSVTFVFVAASSGEIFTGALEPYGGVGNEPGFDKDDPMKPQLDQVKELVSGRTIDALFMSLGGNDAGFVRAIISPLMTDFAGGDPLSFEMLQGPCGAAMDPDTGQFHWQPTFDQEPGPYTVLVQVADDGFPRFSDSGTFQITLHRTNCPPVFEPIPDQVIAQTRELVLTVSATDPDEDDRLTFTLVSGLEGASIDPQSGLFHWHPTHDHEPGTYEATVEVRDDGQPQLIARTSFAIHVTVALLAANRMPVIDPIDDQTVFVGEVLEFDDPTWTLTRAYSATIEFTVQGVALVGGQAFLDGWIDFNADGVWEDPGEQVIHSFLVNADGTYIVTVPVPAGAAPGTTYARFRLSSAGGLDPQGPADDGEVEDYAVVIRHSPWQNADFARDVNGDGLLTPLDVLLIIGGATGTPRRPKKKERWTAAKSTNCPKSGSCPVSSPRRSPICFSSGSRLSSCGTWSAGCTSRLTANPSSISFERF
jgi:hypothetical protein